mgnify:CR=1 FL=1
MNIFVAKLSYATSEDNLRGLFESYGEVSYVKIIVDHATGRSKGFAFVEMPNEEEAESAINALNEIEFQGKTIVVKPKSTAEGPLRPNSGGFRGGNRRRR